MSENITDFGIYGDVLTINDNSDSDVDDAVETKLVSLKDFSSKLYPLLNSFGGTSYDNGMSEDLINEKVCQKIYGEDVDVDNLNANKIVHSLGYDEEYGLTSDVVSDLVKTFIYVGMRYYLWIGDADGVNKGIITTKRNPMQMTMEDIIGEYLIDDIGSSEYLGIENIDSVSGGWNIINTEDDGNDILKFSWYDSDLVDVFYFSEVLTGIDFDENGNYVDGENDKLPDGEQFYLDANTSLAAIQPDIPINKGITHSEVVWDDLSCGRFDLTYNLEFIPHKPDGLSEIKVTLGVNDNDFSDIIFTNGEQIEGEFEVFSNKINLIGKSDDRLKIDTGLKNTVSVNNVITELTENKSGSNYISGNFNNSDFSSMDKKSYTLKKTVTLNPIDKKVNVSYDEDDINWGNILIPQIFNFGSRVSKAYIEILKGYYIEDDSYFESTGIFVVGNGVEARSYASPVRYVNLSYDEIKNYTNDNINAPLWLYLPVSCATPDISYYDESEVLFYIQTNFNVRNSDWYDATDKDVKIEKHYPKIIQEVVVETKYGSGVKANDNRCIWITSIKDSLYRDQIICKCKGAGNEETQSGYFWDYNVFGVSFSNSGKMKFQLYDDIESSSPFQTINITQSINGYSRSYDINTKCTYQKLYEIDGENFYKNYDLPYIVRKLVVTFL